MDAMRPCALRRASIRLYVNQLLEAVLRPDTTAVLSIFMDEVQVNPTRAPRMRDCRGVPACGSVHPCARARAVRVFCVFVCACA
jgi:hypothetical protein